MDRTINVLIQSDGITVDTHRSLLYSKHYLNIVLLYARNDNSIIIKHLQAQYQREDVNLFFELPLNDNIPVKGGDIIMKENYTDIIGKHVQIKNELSSFPGSDDYSRFINYYVTGISMILSLFGLLSNDKESLLLQPLHLIFPDLKIDINILNPKLYYFLEYYIDTLTNMVSEGPFDVTILNHLLEFIDNYLTYFDSYITQNEPETKKLYDDIVCIHASNLGYGKYLESRIKSAMTSHLKFKDELNNLTHIKQNELKKYYDDEILTIMEQTTNIKNINKEIIIDTTNFIKRNKDEVMLYFGNMKESFETETRKKLSSFLDEKNKETLGNFHQISKKAANDLSLSVINLENKQVLKIKEILNDLLDRKMGVIKELNDNKSDILVKLQDFRSECKREILESKNDALNNIDIMLKQGMSKISGLQNRFEILENEINLKTKELDLLVTEITNKLSLIDNIKKNNYDKYMEEIWTKIEPELKKQSKIIIQSAFDETLETLGVAIDKLIEKKIEIVLKGNKRK